MRSLLLVLVACGPSVREQAMRDSQDFQCRDRIASYAATRHMGGDEVGVQLDCAEAGPRIKRWRMDKKGQKIEDSRKLTPGEFDQVWREIDGSGWPNLGDCRGSLGKQDPIYTFDVKDNMNKATFMCQSVGKMPYPHHTLVDALDVAAQKDKKELGDDEPKELKYDRTGKDKQK
jgi:hypothetical protein